MQSGGGTKSLSACGKFIATLKALCQSQLQSRNPTSTVGHITKSSRRGRQDGSEFNGFMVLDNEEKYLSELIINFSLAAINLMLKYCVESS